MDAPFEVTLQIVLTVLAGISAQVIAEYFKVPSIIFLLLFGIGLGPDVLDWLHPQSLGIGLEVMVALSVALILFEGGLSLELKDLGQVSTSLRNLVTTGIFVTLIGGGMAAHWLGEFPWPLAFLYASLVVVTGPTVINPLLRQVKVDRKVAALLEGEGVLIDPVGAILAVVVLDIILNGDAAPISVVSGLLIRLGIGAAIGALGGAIIGLFLKRADFLSEELRNLVVLAGLWGLFGLAQNIRSESGLMAAVVAGIVVRALSVPDERLLRRFKGQLTILAVSVLFVLLAADLSIASVFALGRGALLTVLVLMLIVRPLNIWLCTRDSDLDWRQKTFLSWIAPRGIVSASVASLFGILLTDNGISGGDAIKALVFLTIILTVLVQGLSARWVAQLLRLTSSQSSGAVVVGCNPLSLLIARLYKEHGESVVLIDTDEEACQQAEQENLKVFLSSALDVNVLEEAGLASAGTLLAMTNNGEVNAVIAQKALEEFQPPRVLAVFPKDKSPETLPSKSRVQPALTPQISLKTWNNYIRDGAVRLGETRLRSEGTLFQQAHLKALIRSKELVPLLVERDNRLRVALAEDTWQVGDRIIYLLHDPKPKLLKRLSGGNQPTKLTLETLPTVEEVPMPSPMVEPPPPPPPTATSSADGAMALDQDSPNGRTPSSPAGEPSEAQPEPEAQSESEEG
ncbi:Na(+)/H(+) antiporter ApNhaP [Halomicronema hongdechloris C2206]|uniref:Na(+)/H(+) antiporter ApNhaP n=1 Tax=Halomicronema hongdechloris C2206 TaxID=1641165 RepID=A0A1Z3HM34_9CYAN|nr:cation:proton antiporter [Halomicronema hongdechloris]ASC71361.1 Na(+)/H(+) antiporter ApNhaP [Halomicronema hongdechloris C2206]